MTDGITEGRTEGRTDGRTDGGHFIVPLFLMRGTIMAFHSKLGHIVVLYSKLGIFGSIQIKICMWIKRPKIYTTVHILIVPRIEKKGDYEMPSVLPSVLPFGISGSILIKICI